MAITIGQLGCPFGSRAVQGRWIGDWRVL